jgi:hypothetical protein
MEELDEAKLVARQTRDMIQATRSARAGSTELIRTSRESINRSKALIERLDGILAKAENPKP